MTLFRGAIHFYLWSFFLGQVSLVCGIVPLLYAHLVCGIIASLVRTFILVSLHITIIHVSKRIHDVLIVTVDGAWSLWSRWSRCSATCGHGVRKRSRQCTSPRPKFGGRLCDGHPLQTVSCRVKRHCPGVCSLSTREVQHLRNVALFTLLF